MESPAFWSSFQHDPRDAANASLRASDLDRDLVMGQLGDAFAEGRLDRGEFDERTAQASQIKRLGDIPALVSDLVSNTPATLSPTALRVEAERRYHADRRGALTYATPAIICWIIWAWVLASGDGTPFPWPIFVTLGTAMPAIRLWMNPEDHIRARMRRIERRQLPRTDGSTAITDGSRATTDGSAG